MPSVLKSGSLNLLEPSGPVQGCTGIALPFIIFAKKREKLETVLPQNKQVVMKTAIKLLVIQNKVAVGQTLGNWGGIQIRTYRKIVNLQASQVKMKLSMT